MNDAHPTRSAAALAAARSQAMLVHPRRPIRKTTMLGFSPTFTGTDSFSYRVVDRQGNASATATATITVFEVP